MQECTAAVTNKAANAIALVSLHAWLSAHDFAPALAHLVNLCSSPSKYYAEYVMNFGKLHKSTYYR